LIKAVLFDFDGVITVDKTGSETICNYISSKMNIDFELFNKEYRKFNEELLLGKINHADIWSKLCEAIGNQIPYQILIGSFQNTKINNKIIELIIKYKDAGYKIGLVTDNKKDRIDEIIRWNKWDKLFDCVSISAEIGSGKGNQKIFNKTIEKLKIKNQECIFIDNTKKNLIAPNQMGIKTIFYDDEKKNVEELLNNIEKIIKEENK